MTNILYEANNQDFLQDKILYRLSQSQTESELAGSSMPVSVREGARASSAAQIDNGVTPLMQACHHGKGPAVDLLIRKDPNSVRDRDRTGKTAVHYCAENSSLSCIEQVVRLDPALIATKDEDGYTPLHLATIAGNQTVLKFLLAKGTNIHARDNENHTAVHWATVCGEIELLDLLIEAGANPNSPDIHGAYPIHYAAQMCGPNSELGNDVTLGLMVLQKLLQHGADVTVKDLDGRQPLLWAASAEVRPSYVYCTSGSADAILSLVNAGAQVTAHDKDGLTALHCGASRGHLDCVEVLVNFCNAEVDILDTNGCTPLFYSVTLGHADCTEFLLRHGSIPDRQDRKGRTPAHCGAAKGQVETLKLLYRKGADLWRKNVKGDLPLHEACHSGRTDLILWLLSLEKGAMNVANHDGRCPLHIAALSNNVQLCKILMDHKAVVNPIMRNSRGQLLTPVDAALAKGHKNCAQYLQLHGGLPASKLTDKRALQIAMQRALEHGPTGHTGATPSDLDEGIHTPSTISKTPQSPTRFSPSVASQTDMYSLNIHNGHSMEADKEQMKEDRIRELALQDDSSEDAGNVSQSAEKHVTNGNADENSLENDVTASNSRKNCDKNNSSSEKATLTKEGTRDGDGTGETCTNDSSASKDNQGMNVKQSETSSEAKTTGSSSLEQDDVHRGKEQLAEMDNIAPEREPCDGASEDGDSVRSTSKADKANEDVKLSDNKMQKDSSLGDDSANENNARNADKKQLTTSRVQLPRKPRPPTANLSARQKESSEMINDERTHEMLLISSGRDIGLVQDAPDLDSDISNNLDPTLAKKNQDLNQDSTDEGNASDDTNSDDRTRKSQKNKRRKVKAVMSSNRPSTIRAGPSQRLLMSNDKQVNREGTVVLSRKTDNGEAGSESELESDENAETKAKVGFTQDPSKRAADSKNSKDPLKRVMSGGPRKVENLERSLKKKNPLNEVSITQAMQVTMRKYSLERRLFEQLLELKRVQIRHSRVNEGVLIKRMVGDYNKESNHLGIKSYGGPYKFGNYEKYLYDQLRHLQSTQNNRIPHFKPSDDIGKLNRALRQAKIRDLPDDLNSVRDAQSCSHSTHRCHHVVHAYTGVPCAAYLAKAYRQKGRGTRLNLPKINNNYKPKEDSANAPDASRPLDPNHPVTVELVDGNNRQQITLPTELLDKSKKFQLTLSIQPSSRERHQSNDTDSSISQGIHSARSAPDPTLAGSSPLPPADRQSAPPSAGRNLADSNSLPDIGQRPEALSALASHSLAKNGKPGEKLLGPTVTKRNGDSSLAAASSDSDAKNEGPAQNTQAQNKLTQNTNGISKAAPGSNVNKQTKSTEKPPVKKIDSLESVKKPSQLPRNGPPKNLKKIEHSSNTKKPENGTKPAVNQISKDRAFK